MKKIFQIVLVITMCLSLGQLALAENIPYTYNPNYIRVMGCLCGELDTTYGTVGFLGYTNEINSSTNIEGLETKVVKTDFNQAYLIVPKYEGTDIIINKLSYEKDGKITKSLLSNVRDKAVILYCNNSKIRPNTEVSLVFRKKVITFSPQISLKDSIVVLPSSIVNCSDWVAFKK